jgi:hypothetical protein
MWNYPTVLFLFSFKNTFIYAWPQGYDGVDTVSTRNSRVVFVWILIGWMDSTVLLIHRKAASCILCGARPLDAPTPFEGQPSPSWFGRRLHYRLFDVPLPAEHRETP